MVIFSPAPQFYQKLTYHQAYYSDYFWCILKDLIDRYLQRLSNDRHVHQNIAKFFRVWQAYYQQLNDFSKSHLVCFLWYNSVLSCKMIKETLPELWSSRWSSLSHQLLQHMLYVLTFTKFYAWINRNITSWLSVLLRVDKCTKNIHARPTCQYRLFLVQNILVRHIITLMTWNNMFNSVYKHGAVHTATITITH